MPKLIIVCGIPGSGKTTYANSLADKKTLVLSSDAIRVELFGDVSDQTNNSQVFNTMYKRAIDGLFKGYNVVLDSTNINRKARKQALDRFAWIDAKVKFKIERECVMMCTPYEQCVNNDKNRNSHHVPTAMIAFYMNLFEIPMKSEGFDKVTFHFSDKLSNTKDLLNNLKAYDSKMPSARMKFYDHSVTSELYFEWGQDGNYERFNEEWRDNIINALLLHEISKPLIPKLLAFNTTDKAQYYVDSRISAYMSMCTEQFKYGMISPDAIALINYHSVLYGSKNKDEVINMLTNENPTLVKAMEAMHYYDVFESDMHKPISAVFGLNAD